MDKRDLTISNDDLAEIFGGMDVMPAIKPAFGKPSADKKAAPDKPADKNAPATERLPDTKEPPWKKEEPVKSKLILNRAEEAFKAQEMLVAKPEKKPASASASDESSADKKATAGRDEHSVDDLIKRAQEIEKQMAAEPEKGLVFADFIDEKTVAEMIHAFNDLKSAFSKELAGKIDQRSVDNMMLRTLERTAVSFVLLKNTSWDPEGQLKLDGSIDPERFVKNMSAYREQIQEIDKEIEESLKALMFMRLVAVKKGLGADKYSEIKNGLIRRSSVVEGGYKKAISKFIKKNIMENSMRKADEEK
jgi:hypothetical protein